MTLDSESAAVPLDQSLGDEQPHAAAVMSSRQDILDLDEGPAKLCDPFLGDPDAGVGDHDPDSPVADAHADRDAATLGSELDGVADQVDQHLPEAPPVSPHNQFRRRK